MDGSDFLTGALVALVAAVVIPFLTTEFSLRSARRTAVVKARREAFDQMKDAEARAEMRALALYPSGGSRVEIAVANDEERQAASRRFFAQFALSDKDVYEVAALSPIPLHGRLIISSWANGQNMRSRRAARRLLADVRQTARRTAEQRVAPS